MRCVSTRIVFFAAALGLGAGYATGSEKSAPAVGFSTQPGKLLITIAGEPFATYVYHDEVISRPYFAHIKTPGGIQVTRNHPPLPGDPDDHATIHPGLWLAFGDISGNDYWRLKAKTRHEKFLEGPAAEAGRGAFTVLNRYLSRDGAQTICTERCSITILAQPGHVRPTGVLILWDSTFSSEKDGFTFGDQEEMGLGVRVATPLAVNQKKGGRITDSEGRVNGKEVWGKQADWCDYGGILKGRRVGVTLMPHPKNFRRSWNHARDYGLIVANPFGRNAFTRRPKSAVVVKRGESLRLRYGVFIYELPAGTSYDPQKAYADYLQAAAQKGKKP
jgi:hypothetical protein